MEAAEAPVGAAHPFHFNLKSLLLVTAAVAVMLAPTHWFGAAYLVSVGFSVGLVVCTVYLYSKSVHGAALGVALAGTVGGFVFAMVLLVFFLHTVLNLLLSLVLTAFAVPPRMFALATAGLMVVVYSCAIRSGVDRMRELAGAKQRFPIVSLASRLSFEQAAAKAAAGQAPTAMTPAVAARLTELEDIWNSHYYGRALSRRLLHENMESNFGRAAGFGVSRMPRVFRGVVELEPRAKFTPPIPLRIESLAPEAAELLPVHETATFDFFDIDRIGYVPRRLHAAGFESHGSTSLAERLCGKNCGPSHWHLTRLELVSLLRHDEPRVYIAESLPQMDELDDVPHRALNEFEAAALPQLEAAEDLVIDQKPGRIQMLGSLRATSACLQCHEGNRGKLLGAFSYEIVPVVESGQTAATTASGEPLASAGSH